MAHLGDMENAALVLAAVNNPHEAEQTAGWLRRSMSLRTPIPTLLLCDRESTDLALPLLGLGAVDCLCRPLDLGRLAYLIDMLTVRARMAPAPALETKAQPHSAHSLDIDKSFLYLPATPGGQILEQVRRVAPLDTNILLQGETGTGKTRMARLIHELSPRKSHPFQVVNCGALSATVIESEMFGHVRGAFTSADRDRVGKFAEAGAGTVLLDDLDCLPAELQAKLLRVVEERVFEPLGSNQSQPMKARLVVASNRNLSEEVTAGRMRPDLYFRLCVVAFFLPSLRENAALIAPLAQRFLEEFAERMGRPLEGITPEALAALQAYAWPGNIRELRNIMERAAALSTSAMCEVKDLPPQLLPSAPPSLEAKTVTPKLALAACSTVRARQANTLADAKQTAEAIRIAEALTRNKHNRLRTAAELGISRMTLYKKMHLYGLMEAMPA
jgi:DNA-binding NtrC family response regulator